MVFVLNKWSPMTAWLLCLAFMAGNPKLSSQAQTSPSKIMACYFMGGLNQNFPGSDIDPNLCTHIICAGGVVTPDGITPYFTNGTQHYEDIVALKTKNPNLKVMISLQSGYDSVISSSAYVDRFALKAMMYLEKLGMDGIDLDWEFPTSSQKPAEIQFIQTLSKYLHSSGFLLSMALPANPDGVLSEFDVKTINETVDFITVMTYDFNGYHPDRNLTDYNSPLYTPKGDRDYTSTADGMTFFLVQGIPSHKLLMGIPTYGRSWTLKTSDQHGLHSQATGVGKAAPYTGSVGVYAYSDVCVAIAKGGIVVDDHVNVGSYLYLGDQWVAFDSFFTIAEKTKWVKERHLGGVGIWAYQLDDIAFKCGKGQMPLINAIQNGLKGN